MFNIEEFKTYIQDTHGINCVFIYNSLIQHEINNNAICTCENIEKLVIKIMDNKFYVETLTHFVDYGQSYVIFNNVFAAKNYNKFNYFYCTFSATDQRAIIIFPLHYKDKFYKKLCKLDDLKIFL